MKRQLNKHFLFSLAYLVLLTGLVACTGYTVLQTKASVQKVQPELQDIVNPFPLALPIVRAEYRESVYKTKMHRGGSIASQKSYREFSHYVYDVYLIIEVEEAAKRWEQSFGVICELPDGHVVSYILNETRATLQSGQLHEVPISITSRQKGYARFTLSKIEGTNDELIVYDKNEPFISKEIRLD